MQNKKNKFWIIIGIVLLIVILFYHNYSLNNKYEPLGNTSITVHYYEKDGSEIWSDGKGNFLPYNPEDINKDKKNLFAGVINKLIGKNNFAIIPYVAQCIPDSCPSIAGYTQTNIYCNDAGSITNPNTCFRVCETSTQGYVTPVIKTCTYECDSNEECGHDDWISTPGCSMGNVYQPFRTYTCAAYTCSSSVSTILKETCASGCTNGICNTCVPSTCTSLGKTCGTWDDGCGGTLDCGVCQVDKVSFNIIIQNTGQVLQKNLFISDSNPIELKNSLIDNTPFSLAGGDVKVLNTNLISVQSSWRPSKTFTVTVSGTDDYTQTATTKQASRTISFGTPCISEGTYTGTNWAITYSGYGMTQNANYIWITSLSGPGRVHKYFTNGTYMMEWTPFNARVTGGEFSGQSHLDGITQDANYIWITSSTDAEVYKYNLNDKAYTFQIDGTILGAYTGVHWDTAASGNTYPMGITQDGSNIWIVDANAAEVYKYTMSGAYTGVHWDTAASGNTAPKEITKNGNYFWITDLFGKVYKYNIDGSYTGINWVTNGGNYIYGISNNGNSFWIVSTDRKVSQYTMISTC